MHLTNSSINKHNKDPAVAKTVLANKKDCEASVTDSDGKFGGPQLNGGLIEGQSYIHSNLPNIESRLESDRTNEYFGGTKRSFSWLWQKLEEAGRIKKGSSAKAVKRDSYQPRFQSHTECNKPQKTVEDLWSDIKEVCIKTLLSVESSIPSQPNSFELFGFDVIIDDNLRPWLLEVNASPSMSRENVLDHRVKDALIRDTIALVDPVPFDRVILVKALERRRRANEASSARMRSVQSQRKELAEDLINITRGRLPRRVGERARFQGAYEALCPCTSEYLKISKIKGSISRGLSPV